ncbi:MAG: MFS transporter [Eggerthellaceae bacterium]|nr:MFS transporter [Eggerthellaceae bacterium]
MSEETRNAFQEAPQAKKMLTLFGLYVALIAQLCTSVTFSGWLRTAQLEFTDGQLYILAMSIGGILGLIAMPLYGYFAAKNPAIKRPLIVASLLIGVIVLLGRAMAPNMMTIVLVSAFWGFVSAGIYVLGFTLIRDMFDQAKAGLYLGFVGTMMSIGMLAGPLLGGAIMQSPVGWRGWNIVLAVFMAIAMLMVFFGVSVKKADVENLAAPGHSFDVIGTIGLMVLLGALIIMLSMTTFFPLGGTVSNVLAVIALIGLVIMVVTIMKKGDAAIVPKKVFKDRTSVLLALTVFFAIFTSMALSMFMPQYIPSLAGDPIIQAIDPETKGLAMLLPTACLAFAGLFLGPIYGKLIAKARNIRGVSTFASIVQIAVFVAFIALFLGVLGKNEAGAPHVPYIAILVLMLLAGIYNSRNTVITATAQMQVKPEIRVQSNSIIQVGQNLAGGIAIPVFGMIQAMYAMPLIAAGTPANVAGVMALPDAMPVIMMVVAGASVLLLIVGLFLKPLPQEENAGK